MHNEVNGEVSHNHCSHAHCILPGSPCASRQTPRSPPAVSPPSSLVASAGANAAANDHPKGQQAEKGGAKHTPARVRLSHFACSATDPSSGRNTHARIRHVGARDVVVTIKGNAVAVMNMSPRVEAALAIHTRQAVADHARQTVLVAQPVAVSRPTIDEEGDEEQGDARRRITPSSASWRHPRRTLARHPLPS